MRSFAPIVIAFAVLAPPVRAADDAAPSTTLPPRADVPLPRLVCFGDDLLNRAEAIVEGAAESVTTLGRGVSVTRIHVDHTLLLPADGIALTDV